MALTGDFGKLEAKLALLKRLPTQVRRAGLRAAGAWVLREVQLEFALSRAPDGTPWAKLKWRKGKPLVLTGKLSRSWKLRVGAKYFVLLTNVPYAAFHQFGANLSARVNAHKRNGRFKKRSGAEKAKRFVKVSFSPGGTVKARPMLPANDAPPRWRAAIERCFRDAMTAALHA